VFLYGAQYKEEEVNEPLSENLSALSVLKPILDALFGVAAIVMFAEFLIVLRRAVQLRFTAGRLVELCVIAFIFVICLDWVAGFDFFKNTIAPIVWNILNGGSSG
jgi:hypothetical protein